MPSHRYFPAILLASLFLAGIRPVRSAEPATIPYAKLDEIWQKIDQIDQKKLVVSAQISSRNKDVKPADITMTIKSASGAIPIRIGPEGDLVGFPRTEALRQENPPIETNQPKGTLALSLGLGLIVPATNSFPYARLVEGVAEGSKVVKTQAGMLSLALPSLKAVVFVFPRAAGGKATVDIGSAGAKKQLTADASGQVKLVLDAKLTAENPVVRVSERPARILLSPE